MIFKNNERVKVSELPEYQEMLKALPEIKSGKPVYMKVLDRKKTRISGEVEGEGTQTFYVYPTYTINLSFDVIDNGVDRITYRYQEGIPRKDREGNYEFRKVIRTYTNGQSDTYIFNTDPKNPRNNVEELFLIWAYSELVENGKSGNKQKAFWRFADFTRDSQYELDNETKQAETILAINKASIEELSVVFEKVFKRSLGNVVGLMDVRKQFVAKVKSDQNVMLSTYEHLVQKKEDSPAVSEEISALAEQAIERGFIIQGVDGVSVVLKTAQKEETIYEGDALDASALALFVASDKKTRDTLKRVMK